MLAVPGKGWYDHQLSSTTQLQILLYAHKSGLSLYSVPGCRSLSIGVLSMYFLVLLHPLLRYMLGIAALPSIVRLVAFFFLPESPRWLVAHGHSNAAKAVLKKLRGGEEEEAQRELREIQEDLEQSSKENNQGKSSMSKC